MYDVYNRNVFPFHEKIGKEEQSYINAIVSKYDYRTEFKTNRDVSPYSFSISIDKEKNITNLTRVNIGSVEMDISRPMKRLIDHLKIKESVCAPDFKYYGVGWDLVDGIVKLYTLRNDKTKIECHVYKVKRDSKNEITDTTFHTKKVYDVGKRNTVMYKDGKKVNQRNVNRDLSADMKHPIANEWMSKMKKLGFILDTHSDYDGNINLYFD
jgi:predicted heme/steroid binding protein